MTSAEILRTTQTALAALVTAAGGDIAAADNYDDALEILGAAPASWRLVLGWDSFAGEGEDSMRGIVTANFFAIVQTPRGLPRSPGHGRHRDKIAGEKSTMARADLVSHWLRSARWVTDQDEFHKQVDPNGADVSAARWLEDEELSNSHQIRLDWSLVIGLDPIDTFAIPTESTN